MKKILYSTVALTLLTFVGASQVSADGCQPVYGGGETCTTNQISITKTVFNPADQNVNDPNAYVTNLGVNDAKYQAGYNVTFHITVSNNTTSNISNITVNDIFPQYLSYVGDFSATPGTFNANSGSNGVWTATIATLQPNHPITYTLVGRVVSNNQLPQNTAVTCTTNEATAITSDNKSVQATSQFCIQLQQSTSNNGQTSSPTSTNQSGTSSTSNNNPSNNGQGSQGTNPFPNSQSANNATTKGGLPVLPPAQVGTTPHTGPEALPLIGLLPTGVIGYYLRKIARK